MTPWRRRAFLFGGAASLAGCATPSVDECDPARGGFIRGVRCGPSGYVEHGRVGEVERDAQRRRYELERDRYRALEAEYAGLEREIAEQRARAAGLEQEGLRLEGRLARAAQTRAAMRTFLSDLNRAVAEVEALHREALAFQLPALLRRPLPAWAPLDWERRRADGVRAHDAGRRDVEFSLQNLLRHKRELLALTADFVKDQIQGEIVQRIVKGALFAVRLGRFHPLVKFLFLIGDIWDLIKRLAAGVALGRQPG